MSLISRYGNVPCKMPRETVMLKGFPCAWRRCSFCDYHLDNDTDEEKMNQENFKVLDMVTGEHGRLDVINSGSAFEIPKATMERIKEVVKEKNIKEIFFEAHWLYKNRFHELHEMFDIPVKIRVGVETFDDDFRNNVYKKGMVYKSIDEVAEYADSVCLLVGVKGQTKEMIDRDIEILTTKFKYGTVNIFVNNSTKMERDEELISWFKEKYRYLEKLPNIDILFDNKDLGVFT